MRKIKVELTRIDRIQATGAYGGLAAHLYSGGRRTVMNIGLKSKVFMGIAGVYILDGGGPGGATKTLTDPEKEPRGRPSQFYDWSPV